MGVTAILIGLSVTTAAASTAVIRIIPETIIGTFALVALIGVAICLGIGAAFI